MRRVTSVVDMEGGGEGVVEGGRVELNGRVGGAETEDDGVGGFKNKKVEEEEKEK